MKKSKSSGLILGLTAVFYAAQVMAAWQAGLNGGYVANNANWTDWPAVTNIYLSPEAAATQVKPPWADNRTWAYWGQMYFNGGTYYFAENIDDATYLKIDGVVYINDSIWNFPAKSGPVNLAKGWHDLEMRFGNGTGGAGPVVGNGWTATKGFGYNIGGPDTNQGGDYIFPIDDGSMSLFRYDDGTGFGAPTVETLPATGVTLTTAAINGGLVSTGISQTAVIAYWGTSDGGMDVQSWANTNQLGIATQEPQNFSLPLTGLAMGTTYHYRFAATNDYGLALAPSSASFTTLPSEPLVANGTATDVLNTSAALHGTITYEGAPPTRLYAFWATNDCGTSAAAWLANGGGVAEALGAVEGIEAIAMATGLLPNTGYYHNFMVSNAYAMAWGTTNAAPSFRTEGEPGLSAVAADLVIGTSARLNATQDQSNQARMYFIWGTAADALLNTNDLGVVPMGAYSASLPGLNTETTYYFQVHVENAYGSAASEVIPFTTLPTVGQWTTVADGKWGDPATWNVPSPPVEGTPVTINHNVTLDLATPQLASVTVNSGKTLTFDGWETLLSATTVTIDGTLTHTNNTDFVAADGWTPNGRVNIACSNFTLAAGATVNGVGKGFSGAKKGDNAGYGPGRGLTYGLAASYGGRGGWPMGSLTAPQSGPLYGVADEPEMPGSGGGRGDSNTLGGSGGGAMRIDATGVVTIDGTVSMDGTYGSGNHQTGGSGGAIWITCKRLAGSGVLSARGGRGQMSGGGGGGGRIAVDYDPTAQAAVALPQVKCNAAGGSIGSDYELSPNISAGKPGTLWFPDHQFLLRTGAGDRFRYSGQWMVEPELTSFSYTGDFFMDDGGLIFHAPGFVFSVSGNLVASCASPAANFLSLTNGTLSIGGTFAATNLIVELRNGTLTTGAGLVLSGSRLYMRNDGPSYPSQDLGGDLTLAAASQFRIWSGPTNTAMPEYGALVAVQGTMSVTGKSWVYPYSNPTNGGSAWFNVGSLSVSSDSGFNAAEKGYRGGDKLAHPYGWGPGGGWYRPNWTGGTFGGGGGGYGGNGGANDGVQGLANGLTVAPFGPGSGGGRGDGDGSAGGGAIRIRSAGPVVLDGTFNADGAKGVPNWGGPGSGGAIWVICNGFNGGSTALMTAKGGDGVNGNYSGGGGGRIAVWHKIAEGRESVMDELIKGDTRHANLSTSLGTYSGAVSVTNGYFTAAANPPPQVGTVVFVEIPPPQQTMMLIR